jgi:hypothetical protein
MTRLEESKREQIITELQRYIAPDDIILAIFSSSGGEPLPANDEKIHRAIYELKKKYPQWLGAFSFSRNDVYPFSKLLERVLLRLEISHLVIVKNPNLIIPPESKQYIQENVLPLFTEEQKEQLKQMGELFKQLVG